MSKFHEIPPSSQNSICEQLKIHPQFSCPYLSHPTFQSFSMGFSVWFFPDFFHKSAGKTPMDFPVSHKFPGAPLADVRPPLPFRWKRRTSAAIVWRRKVTEGVAVVWFGSSDTCYKWAIFHKIYKLVWWSMVKSLEIAMVIGMINGIPMGCLPYKHPVPYIFGRILLWISP